MRIMALDIGQARVGIAISDPQEKVATPLCVLPADAVVELKPDFKRLLEDWEPELFVCGLPLTLSNEQGSQAHLIRGIADTISRKSGIPYEFVDERLSSQEAKRILREKGIAEREMRGKIDMIAASLFLQTWLDARENRDVK